MFTTLAEKKYGKELGEAAAFFRSIASEIDLDPNKIMKYVDHPALIMLRSDRSDNVLNKAKMYEALAYGDTGVLFASPRPCLSGLLLKEIGNQEQYEDYHYQVREHALRTCFAVTEPKVGSDVSQIESVLSFDEQKKIWNLNGHKCLFGNGVCADIGTVWARTSDSPLGIRAVLVRLKENATPHNIEQELLPMLGLRGAQLSSVKFKDFPVEPEDVIGLNANPLKRGLLSLLYTFNKMRICIAALAIGQAQGICDYVKQHRLKLSDKESNLLSGFEVQINALRDRIYLVAEKLDQAPNNTAEISLLKSLATGLIERLINQMFVFFGQAAFFEHPFLAKSYRDAFAYEYADGTIHIQRNNIFDGYNNGILAKNL